ncbi:MAG: sigma-54-dependent Fis family transcriptional regulator [Rhodocyclales bacterium]|nr:sigma-54-dependent Fis family transcriptional regulator [Rhodocyclales bacterium]
MKPKICLIEDDPYMGTPLQERLEMDGYACDWYQTGRAAMQALREKRYELAISDIRLPDIAGDALFEELRGAGLTLPPFLFITGHGAIDQAVKLLKLGARDYITKPFDIGQLMTKVRELTLRQIPDTAGNPLGISAAMRGIANLLPKLAASRSPVLITGESGVGKEEVARRLHRINDADGKLPFVAVNCGAIPENLIESELFGHERGAFTGALRSRDGVFVQAHGGTLFLDEIGEMPPSMQVKLLRAIQERAVVPVGGSAKKAVDIRLVCATHRDLKAMVESGEFREDLYYRIHVIHLPVPPLRERREDVLWLAERFLAEMSAADGKPYMLSARAAAALANYPWPGNIRELRHCLERAAVLSAAPCFETEAIFGASGQLPCADDDNAERQPLGDYLHACERDYIRRALDECGGRIAETAGMLGISRKNLWQKMRKLGMGEG